MCMRMGSDAGRNFLSTKDPVRSTQRGEGVDSSRDKAELQQQLSVAGILERIFAGKKSEK